MTVPNTEPDDKGGNDGDATPKQETRAQETPEQDSAQSSPRADSGPTREEFDALGTIVTGLVTAVEALAPVKPDSTPLDKGPWLYRGGKKASAE